MNSMNSLNIAGPNGRFDLNDPSTVQMVRSVSANPNLAPQHNVTLAEIFQLQRMLERLSSRPMMPTTTVYDDLKNAALQQATRGMVGQQQGLGQLAQPMPQQMPQEPAPEVTERGIGSLPVDNFQPENYARGGIVAFAQGSEDAIGGDDAAAAEIYRQQAADPASRFGQAITTRPTAANLFQGLLSELEDTRSRYTPRTLEEIAQAREAADKAALERAGITGKPLEAREQQIKAMQARAAEDKSDALRNFLMSTGFRMAAEASRPGNPYARGLGAITQPLSVGAAGAAPEYMAEQKELRKLTADRDKELADIQDKRYAAVLSGRQYDQATKDKEDARIENYDAKILGVKSEMAKTIGAKEVAAAARDPKELQIFANSYLLDKRAKGDKRPDEVILQEGSERYLNLKAAEPVRAFGITTTADTERERREAKAVETATTSVSKRLEDKPYSNAAGRKYQGLLKTDPAAAEAFKTELIRQEIQNQKTAKSARSSTGQLGTADNPIKLD